MESPCAGKALPWSEARILHFVRCLLLPIAIGIAPLLLTAAWAQPFPQAHSHNDYEHKRPLLDALQNGFTSVEADVFLVHGKLLVAHTYPVFSSRTLEGLYFAPLDSILSINQGRVYPGYPATFYLMIDIKSEGEPAYAALKDLLARYPRLAPTSSHTLRIFLSGNRPKESILSAPIAGFALDGRPDDIGKGYSKEVMPVVSDTFQKWSAWNGKGTPASDDMNRIRDLAARVHAEGKILRLWAIPDHQEGWKALLGAGVDLINTDHLKELNNFLKAGK